MHLAHKAHGTATAAVEWDVLEPLETEPPPRFAAQGFQVAAIHKGGGARF